MTEHNKYTEAKTAMLVHVPFFSSLLFDLMDVRIGKFPHIFGGLTPTAATDGRHMWIDEDYLNTLKLPEVVFLLCHEIGHTIWQHMPRAKYFADMGFEGEEFDRRRWNYAGDYVINDMLVKSKIGDMPKGGLLKPDYTHDMLVDDVYRDLKDKMPPKKTITIMIGNGQGGMDGQQAQGDGNDGGTLDVHIHAPSNMTDAEVKRAVQTAVEAAKAMGKLPGALERFAEKFLKPVVSWKERLRYHVMRACSRETTDWKSPHRRRLVTQKIYFPSYTGFGAGTVVVAVDTSGSIGQNELNRFFGELDDILMTCNPERVILLGCDAEINSVHELSAGEDLKLSPPKMGGGGGTDFKPVFDWVDENNVCPDALIYFTDMYGGFPSREPVYPVIWCATTEEKAPWGELIHVPLGEE